MSNRDRAVEVLREAGDIHPTSILSGWFIYAADALIAAGLIDVGRGPCQKASDCCLPDGHADECVRT